MSYKKNKTLVVNNANDFDGILQQILHEKNMVNGGGDYMDDLVISIGKKITDRRLCNPITYIFYMLNASIYEAFDYVIIKQPSSFYKNYAEKYLKWAFEQFYNKPIKFEVNL